MEEVVELESFITDSPNMNTYQIENVQLPPSDYQNLFKDLIAMIEKLGIKDFTSNEKLTGDKIERAVNISEETWVVYEKIRQTYSLEGDQNKWIACLVYIVYYKIMSLKRKNFLFDSKSFSDEYQPVLSLNKLLSLSQSSLLSFICKLNKLIKILQAPDELYNRVSQIEMNLNVSCIIFAKYKVIFSHLFSGNAVNKGIREIFEFGWMLFVLVKGKLSP